MKIKIKQKEIQQAVRNVSRVVQKNPQLSVLGCILLATEKGKVCIRATNLEIGVEYVIPGVIEEEGMVAIPAGILSAFVGSLQGDHVMSLELVNEVLVAKTAQGSTKIKTVAADDFPTLPQAQGTTFSLPASKLYESLHSVAFCASPSMIRPELASVYLAGREEGLVSVATDSFRLAEKKVPISNSTLFDPILLPARTVGDVLTLLDGAENVQVALDEHHITFDTGNGLLTSRLTSGNFPDYTQILPKEFVTHATILSQDFIDGLKKVAIFSDSFSKVAISINPKEKKFILTAQNADTGETIEQVPGALEGEELSVNFNYRYISEVYQVLKSDSTQLSFAGVGKPLLIQGIGDTSFLYIVMPMNR